MSESHIAAQPIEIGPFLRQRCAWCGTTLLDYDLRLLMYPDSTPEGERRPATWEPGAIIRNDGVYHGVVDHEDGDRIPDDCCGQLDPSVTK